MQNEIPDIKNFASVWARVERKSAVKTGSRPETKAVINFRKNTRATKFLPKF